MQVSSAPTLIVCVAHLDSQLASSQEEGLQPCNLPAAASTLHIAIMLHVICRGVGRKDSHDNVRSIITSACPAFPVP